MNFMLALLIAFAALTACASPETARSRGSGPGADVGNRAKVVEMHEGSEPFYKTPQIIGTQHAPVDSANQAFQLSRQ